jgi:hypothetical protein
MPNADAPYFQKANKPRPNFNPAGTEFDPDVARWLAD